MFINTADLNSSLYPEIKQAIARGQDTIVELHINEALSYIQSRLSTKYDILTEFAKTGEDRHPLLVKYAKDIAIYFLYDLPESIPLKRVKAYEDAIKWLDDLNKGFAVLAGVDPAPISDDHPPLGSIVVDSNEKRRNEF
jgi:phage gp36-like protein